MTNIVKAVPFFEAEAREIGTLYEGWRNDFRQGFERIFKIGEILKDVKSELPHGSFISWVETNCPFDRVTAHKYIKLYQNQAVLNVACMQHIGIEAALKLLRGQKENGTRNWPDVGEGCGVEDLYELIKQGKKFGTIYADPPWPYENQATRSSTDKHYKTMTMEDIANLPVAQLTDEAAHLHLWTTNAFLYQAFSILKEWGFEYKGVFVWVKGRITNGKQEPQLGIGNYWRVCHEFMLLGVKGGLCFDKSSACPSWFLALRGKHSAKPETIRKKIERVSPPQRLELFGRKITHGWVTWGDEIERDLFYRQIGTE